MIMFLRIQKTCYVKQKAEKNPAWFKLRLHLHDNDIVRS